MPQSLEIKYSILSEIAKPQPNKKVNAKHLENIHQIYVATTVWHELNFGLNIMPIGKKRQIVENFLLMELATFPMPNA